MSGNRNEFFPYDDDDDDENIDNQVNIEATKVINSLIEDVSGTIDEVRSVNDEVSDCDEFTNDNQDISEPQNSIDDQTDIKRDNSALMKTEKQNSEDKEASTNEKNVTEHHKYSTFIETIPSYSETSGTIKVSLKYQCYLLIQIMINKNLLGAEVFGMEIDPISYNKDDEKMELKYQKMKKEASEDDLVFMFYKIINNWETGFMKLTPEKMDFFRDENLNRKYLHKYLKEGMSFKVEDTQGYGVVCMKNEKLLGTSSIDGGIKVMNQQLDMEIMSKPYDLNDDRVLFLATEDWKNFKIGKEMLIKADNKSLMLIGHKDNFYNLYETITSFINDNCNVVIKVEERRKVVLKCLEYHYKDSIIRSSSSSSSSKMAKVSFNKDGVVLCGVKSYVKKMEDNLKEIIEKLEINTFEESKAGLRADMFLMKDSHENKILNEIEVLMKCAIWVADGAKRPEKELNLFSKFKNLFRKSSNDGQNNGEEKTNDDSNDLKEIQNYSKSSNIFIKSGSITCSKDSKVLVNTLVSRKINNLASCGVVSKSFILKGGDELQKEFEKCDYFPQKFGSDLVTTPPTGDINCQIIFHIYISKYRNVHSLKLMKDAIELCITKAITLGFDSIAFPTLGCGRLGYNVQDVIRCFTEVEQKFNTTSKVPIKITIFAMDESVYKSFKKSLEGMTEVTKHRKPLPLPKFNKKGKPSISNVAVSYEDVKVLFTICYTSECNFDEIKNKLIGKMKYLCNEKKIEHELIRNDFLPRIRERLSSIVKNVNMEIDGERRMILRGPTGDVKTLKKEITTILKAEKEQMKDLPYLRSSLGVKDFLDFYSKNENSSLPTHWKHYKELTYGEKQPPQTTLIDSRGNLFKEINNLVKNTWDISKAGGQGKDAKNLNHLNIEVKQIFLIENPNLYRLYKNSQKTLCYQALASYAHNNYHVEDITNKGEIDISTKDGSQLLDDMLIPEINEYFLFHGSKSDKIGVIMNQGIDSRNTRDDAMFGRGAYFAESSTKADQYTDAKDQRTTPGTILKMFLARVLLGNSYLCTIPHSFVKPPCADNNCGNNQHCENTSHISCDSVVGLCRSDGTRLLFREFVVYKNDVSYPEFLIEYVRK